MHHQKHTASTLMLLKSAYSWSNPETPEAPFHAQGYDPLMIWGQFGKAACPRTLKRIWGLYRASVEGPVIWVQGDTELWEPFFYLFLLEISLRSRLASTRSFPLS